MWIMSLSLSVSLKPNLDSTQSLQLVSPWLLLEVEARLSGIMISRHHYITVLQA